MRVVVQIVTGLAVIMQMLTMNAVAGVTNINTVGCRKSKRWYP
jgi:hypothetical protein